MGMAASQARLLTLTARIHDVEYQAQSIQNQKLALATQQDEVYQDYIAALDETTFTVKNSAGERIVANFNTLCGIDAVKAGRERYVLRDEHNKIIVSDDIAAGYENFKKIGGNAYEFAIFMMNGQPADFNADNYRNKEKEIFTEKNNTAKLGSLEDARDAIVGLLLQLGDILNKNLDGLDGNTGASEYLAGSREDYERLIKQDLFGAIQNITQTLIQNQDSENVSGEFGVSESQTRKGFEILEKINAAYEQLEYKMYTQFGEEIYAADGDIDDFDDNDFWYYVNMFKQIEANGDAFTKISEFSGIDGIGNAQNDSDWLQSMIKSGKITIDLSSIDNKGKISFKSTGVPSDSSLEYTTTSTIDKSKLAKVEAEYEHKMKQIDQKDKKFDMDLSKLETERTALTKEYDSVKKVSEENIQRTFGIFS